MEEPQNYQNTVPGVLGIPFQRAVKLSLITHHVMEENEAITDCLNELKTRFKDDQTELMFCTFTLGEMIQERKVDAFFKTTFVQSLQKIAQQEQPAPSVYQ